MPQRKIYASADLYERKLGRVLCRLTDSEAPEFNFNYDRHCAWVEFRYKGQLYRFDHTVDKARAAGQNLSYGSDAFAQIVLALEDLSRMIGRGIYDLQTWVSGLKFLPAPTKIPECFKVLGFQSMPSDIGDVKSRYRTLSKQHHSDTGGDDESFQAIKNASEQALRHMSAVGR